MKWLSIAMFASLMACSVQPIVGGVTVARGKVYVSALDGMIYALDAKTGTVVWKVDAVEDHSCGTNLTGATESCCAQIRWCGLTVPRALT